MADIFISYSRKDSSRALEFAETLIYEHQILCVVFRCFAAL